jgi:hypothetical protein
MLLVHKVEIIKNKFLPENLKKLSYTSLNNQIHMLITKLMDLISLLMEISKPLPFQKTKKVLGGKHILMVVLLLL